ncbi:MAG: hypothetical protein Q7S00_00080 [bacterium]|nr:hypothetical protein [bacterium]
MNKIELIKLLRKFVGEYKKKIFSLREIADFTGESRASTGMTLIRAKRSGLVEGVGNLWFNKMDPPTLEEFALELKSPSYVSFESALYRHGLLSQSPKGGLTVATLSRPGRFKTPLGVIHYIHLEKKFFSGFDAERIALPEKAFLDLVYIRMRTGTFELSEVIYQDLLNVRRLKKLATSFPGYVGKACLL